MSASKSRSLEDLIRDYNRFSFDDSVEFDVVPDPETLDLFAEARKHYSPLWQKDSDPEAGF